MGLLGDIGSYLGNIGNGNSVMPAPYYADPRVVALSKIAEAAGQASAPSRLPVTNGMVLGQVGGAVGPGQEEGNEASQNNFRTQILATYGMPAAAIQNATAAAALPAARLKNITDLQNYNLTAPYFGMPQLTMSDLMSGIPGQASSASSSAAPAGPLGLLGSPSAADVTGGSNGSPTLLGTPPARPQTASGAGLAASGQPSTASAGSGLLGYLEAHAPAMVAQNGGAPSATAAATTPQTTGTLQDIYNNIPPPILKMRGFPVPDSLVTAYAAGTIPFGSPAWRTLAENEALKTAGITPTFGGDRAGVPLQHVSIGADGQLHTTVVPGSLENMASGAYTNAYNTGMGGLPAKEAQATFEQGLKNKNTLVPMYDPQTQTTKMVTQADALAISQGHQPAVAAPAGSAGLQKDGSYHTANGTVIPAPQNIGPKPSGFQSEPSAGQKATQATYADTIKGWEDSIQPAQQTEQRFQAMWEAANALGGPPGAWAETKVEIGRQLIAAGVSQESVDKLLKADPAQAQIILKNNFGTALSTLGAAKMGRITQNEIFALQKNLPNVSLEPGAFKAITAQGIGIARQQQALARDWSVAQQMGYPDPYSYEREWAKANPLQGFVDTATKELGAAPGQQANGQPSPQDIVDELRRRGVVK